MNDDYMDIPETTFASLYPENDGPDDMGPYDQDENADMFHSAVVSIMDSLFLFDAGISEWEEE